MHKTRWGGLMLRVGVIAVLASAFFMAPRLTASARSAHASPPYTVGVSNNLVGNGWRDEMICSIKAQAYSSGKVKPGGVSVLQNNLNTAEQIAEIRQFIAK